MCVIVIVHGKSRDNTDDVSFVALVNTIYMYVVTVVFSFIFEFSTSTSFVDFIS